MRTSLTCASPTSVVVIDKKKRRQRKIAPPPPSPFDPPLPPPLPMASQASPAHMSGSIKSGLLRKRPRYGTGHWSLRFFVLSSVDCTLRGYSSDPYKLAKDAEAATPRFVFLFLSWVFHLGVLDFIRLHFAACGILFFDGIDTRKTTNDDGKPLGRCHRRHDHLGRL